MEKFVTRDFVTVFNTNAYNGLTSGREETKFLGIIGVLNVMLLVPNKSNIHAFVPIRCSNGNTADETRTHRGTMSGCYIKPGIRSTFRFATKHDDKKFVFSLPLFPVYYRVVDGVVRRVKGKKSITADSLFQYPFWRWEEKGAELASLRKKLLYIQHQLMLAYSSISTLNDSWNVEAIANLANSTACFKHYGAPFGTAPAIARVQKCMKCERKRFERLLAFSCGAYVRMNRKRRPALREREDMPPPKAACSVSPIKVKPEPTIAAETETDSDSVILVESESGVDTDLDLSLLPLETGLDSESDSGTVTESETEVHRVSVIATPRSERDPSTPNQLALELKLKIYELRDSDLNLSERGQARIREDLLHILCHSKTIELKDSSSSDIVQIALRCRDRASISFNDDEITREFWRIVYDSRISMNEFYEGCLDAIDVPVRPLDQF